MNVLYTGGARSGKSNRALEKAEKRGIRRLFIATAEPLDKEMQDRIVRHRAERGELWTTVDEPVEVTSVIAHHDNDTEVFLLDCLTMWISNLMGKGLDDGDIRSKVLELVDALGTCSADVLLVSNEVGQGIVPVEAMGRRYRDLLGWTNQQIAATCDCVVFMVAGLPMVIKGREP